MFTFTKILTVFVITLLLQMALGYAISVEGLVLAATIGTTAFTWIDWAKQIDPDGTTADVIDLLSQTNEILTDMLAVEGNLPTGHQSTALTGYPTAYWRMLNQGVPASKDTNVQVTDTCGMLKAWSQIDKDVAELNGNTASFRLARSKPFLAAMSQAMATAVFY